MHCLFYGFGFTNLRTYKHHACTDYRCNADNEMIVHFCLSFPNQINENISWRNLIINILGKKGVVRNTGQDPVRAGSPEDEKRQDHAPHPQEHRAQPGAGPRRHIDTCRPVCCGKPREGKSAVNLYRAVHAGNRKARCSRRLQQGFIFDRKAFFLKDRKRFYDLNHAFASSFVLNTL